jgi:hypothetical protein
MTRARRVLGPVAAVWLVCHAATLTLVPALLWFTSSDVAVAECTCAQGAEATCPMHHPTTASSKVCVMQSMATNATAALIALFGFVGLMSAPPTATAPVPDASAVLLDCSIATDRPSPPDPPPPRA